MRVLERALPEPLAARLDRPVRVVAAGGGTGLPVVLAGLAAAADDPLARLEITALVSVSDDGGSSGELRRQYRTPAAGDARNCLVALSPRASPLAPLLQHRLQGTGDLPGHTVGNLVLTALAGALGDFGQALDAVARLLGVRGRVLPAVAGEATLVAALEDGRVVHGEDTLRAAAGRIAAVRLETPAPAPPRALAAVRDADLVVLGPGSLYSSVLASVLGEGMAEALRRTRATRVWVANLFTQPGETDGYGAADHVAALQRHLGDVVDLVLLHDRPLPPELVAQEAVRGSQPVEARPGEIERLGPAVVRRNVVSLRRDAPRHDPARLALALAQLARAREA
jgi:uncharacterized cofD-like protein